MKCIVKNYLYFILFIGALAIEKEKIVGGTNADISEFPYQTSLRFNGRHFCGGSIIGDKHILTAAHCVVKFAFNPLNVTIHTGSNKSFGTSGSKYHVQTVNVHPYYLGTESSSYRHDIAVLTLTNKITFHENQTTIEIPKQDVQYGENVTIAGWGILKFPSKRTSPILKKTTMKIIPSSNCLKYMPKEIRNKLILYKEQVCAFHKKGIGACSGDSGSPLVLKNQVVGIASFVVPCAEGYPDVYTKVFAYVNWIKSIMEDSKLRSTFHKLL